MYVYAFRRNVSSWLWSEEKKQSSATGGSDKPIVIG